MIEKHVRFIGVDCQGIRRHEEHTPADRLCEKNGVYGYMDYTGAWLNSPDYEDARYFMEGLAPCKKDGKWGMIDTKGNTVLPFVYDYIQPTSSGIIIAHSENGWNTYMKMAK